MFVKDIEKHFVWKIITFRKDVYINYFVQLVHEGHFETQQGQNS